MAKSSIVGDLIGGAAVGLLATLVIAKLQPCSATPQPSYCGVLTAYPWLIPAAAGLWVGGIPGAAAAVGAELVYALNGLKNIG